MTGPRPASWRKVTVEATGNAGPYDSLALDAQGNPRIRCFDGTTGDLEYADWGVHQPARTRSRE